MSTPKAADPYTEGRVAWQMGVSIRDNPYEWTRPDDADLWDEGWHEAANENAQFGVGA